MSGVDDLIEEFADLDESEAYQLLDELGRQLPKIPESVYVPENIVPGCQSRVWMVKSWAIKNPGDDQTAELQIQADSDAIIVKGLVSLLLEMYQTKTAQQVMDVDYVDIFDSLGLSNLITPQRKNGLHAMVQSIRGFAAQSLGESTTQSENDPVASKPAAKATKTTVPKISRNIETIVSEFPILQQTLPSGKRPVFLDSGASAQKPSAVIDCERQVQEQYYANAFRGRYYFGQRIDDGIEATRAATASLINASSSDQIVFTSGTTMSINLVATSWGRKFLKPGDEVVVSEMGHHANFVPWQSVAKETGATLRILPINDEYVLDPSAIEKVINPKTAMVAISSMSNVLGTVNPIDEICARAHENGAVVLVDAAQSAPHQPIDVQASGIDFLCFSGHKLYGPSGIGILYGRSELLDAMDPFMFGGHMIQTVGRDESTWSAAPAKFEAGTMPIVQIIALGEAIDFVLSVGFDAIAQHEHALLEQTHLELSKIDGLKIHGPALDRKGAIVSFSIDGIATEDLAYRLDQQGVFTRHGNHCAMVLHERLGVPATTRASLGMYNTQDDIATFANAMADAVANIRR